MAFRRTLVLPSFNGVGAGQTATLDLATGRRYFGLYFMYKPGASQVTMEADITEIRVNVNGKVQRKYTLSELNKLNAVNGIPFVNGVIQLLFAEPWLRTWQGEEGYAWGTGDISTFKIEIDIAAGATAPVLSGFAEIDNATNAAGNPLGIGVIKKVKKFRKYATGYGVLNVIDLPKTDAYSRIHFVTAAAIIDKVKIQTDGLDIFERSPAQNALMLARAKLTAQSNVFTYAPDETQQGDSILPMRYSNGRAVSELRIDITTTASGQIDIITETVGLPD